MRRRTDFIWLADQRIDHAAAFATLRGAPLRREDEGCNRWVLARGRFTLAAVPRHASAAITVDGGYKLWLNGRRFGFGPTRSSPWFKRLDRHEVGAALRPGENVVAILIHVPGHDLAWHEAARGGWQPAFGDGGLYCHIEDEGGRLLAAGDESWRMIESSAWDRGTPQAGWGQDFIEDFDARRLDPAWTEPAFDDADWPKARAMVSLGDAAQTARGWGRVEPFPLLIPSEIPRPTESEIGPARLLWVRAAVPRPDLPLAERLYAEQLEPADAGLVTGADALLGKGGEAVVRTASGRDTALLLAFDPYHAGRPFIEVEARGGEVIEIACAEALPGEFGRGTPGDGVRREGALGCANILRYTARPGRQRFERFGWTAVRAMQVVVRNAPEGLTIRALGSTATHYPAAAAGAFACSDPLLTRLWETARHTLLQCMHDSWIDCPGREARQWVGDAVVEFDAAAAAFGPSIFPLQRQFLRQAMESQRSDGLARMFAPGDLPAEALTIPDYTLLWIIGAARYLDASGDRETVAAVLPGIERALAWFERIAGADGLLCELPHWHFIEWADVDRRGKSAPVNALLAGALQAAARLAAACGRPGPARRWRQRAKAVGAALNLGHWDEARGVYVDSVDPATGARGRRVSQHANALMLLFGLAPRARARRLLAAITDQTRLKLTASPPIVPAGEKFDEERDIVRANSFFAHFVGDALARAGQLGWVTEDVRRAFGPMLGAGATTLWESYQPTASLCHGFSATPLYLLSTHCLGITALAAGHARFAVAPQPGDLAWAQGTMPTPHGPIEVEWRRQGGRLQVAVAHPAACRPEPGLVPGFALSGTVQLDCVLELVFERNGNG